MVPALDTLLRPLVDAAGRWVTEGPPWIAGIGAALGVCLLAPVVIRAARWGGHVDEPSAARWHHRPVALMGGVAIVCGGALVALISGAYAAVPGPVWIGAALVFGAGLWDDVWSVRPKTKLLVQLGAAGCVLYAGVGGSGAGPAWATGPLTLLWVVGVTNAFNLIDGLDGLAAGIAAIGGGVLGTLAWMEGDAAVAALAFAAAGAAAGFLVFNAPPARVFMGDSGSMTLGFVLAVLALGTVDPAPFHAGMIVPALALAVPLFDTTFVTITRIRAGRSVFEGGTDHVHHRLAMLWQSERRAVFTLYAGGLLGGALALAMYGADLWTAVPVVAGTLLVAAAGGAWLLRATEPRVHRDRLRRIHGRGDGVAQNGEAAVRPRMKQGRENGTVSPTRAEEREPSRS